MNRVRVLLSTVVPAVIVGGFVFASGLGHADAGRDSDAWPAAADTATGSVLVAQADPWAGRPPVPPVPPAAPAAPAAPAPPSSHSRHSHSHGVSVQFHDGKLELDGIQELVQDQLERVDDIVDGIPDLPPGERAKIKSRVRAVRGKLRGHLSRLKSVDLDQIGPEMERMGDEIEREMEGLDKDLSQFGDQFGKSFEKFGKDLAKNLNVGPGAPPAPLPPVAPAPRVTNHRDTDASDADDDHDDDDDRGAVPIKPDATDDQADMRAAAAHLKGVVLDPDQKAKLAQLRADAEREIAQAKRDLDEMSSHLHDSLADISASEGDIAKQIDQISRKEALIRKARILAWVRARSLLSPDQRKLVEAAARKTH